nr:unnamed protein product [Callosobruchus chinensis]
MGTSLWQLRLYNAAGLCTRWRIQMCERVNCLEDT